MLPAHAVAEQQRGRNFRLTYTRVLVEIECTCARGSEAGSYLRLIDFCITQL